MAFSADRLTTYTGRSSDLYFANQSAAPSTATHSVMGIGDFSLTLDRGTVEQELVGQKGNYFSQGAISIEGSLTSVKLASGAAGIFLDALINNSKIQVSGGVASTSGLRFNFTSGSITGFDLSLGDASTVTEASIDFTVLNPYDILVSETDYGCKLITC